MRGIRGLAVATVVALSLAVGGMFAGPIPSAAAFTGYGCTKATCSYFTSSYAGSHYYYKRCDNAWKGLSTTYLRGFTSNTALLAKYPTRVLHKRC